MIVALLSLALFADADARYANPKILIAAEDLKNAKAGDFVIIDARGKVLYEAGHVPGAVRVDTPTWAKEFKKDQSTKTWKAKFLALGIDGKKPVVVYGATKSVDAARVWWILRYSGLSDVRLLDGGWLAWPRIKGEVEKKTNTPKAASDVTLSPQSKRLMTAKDILDGLKSDKKPFLLDTRSEKEHCGEAKTAKRNGHIPGAKHLEWTETLDPKTGKFKSPDELTKLFKARGIVLDQQVTTYCQSGGRAAVMAFALELMGAKDVRNYYGSWADWGNRTDTPITTPKPKKK